MNTDPVSVIIPTYNRGDVLGRSIASILDQTYENFEIIIVDDNSEDDTEQVVGSFDDSRIRYVKLFENGGAAAARNEGVRQSRYDLIAFQDSDDEWVKDKLEKQVDAISNTDNSVGMVFCSFRYSNGMIIPSEEQKLLINEDMFAQLLHTNVIGTPTMLIKRNCFTESGGFNDSLKCLEDWELSIKVAQKYKIIYIDEILLKVNLSNDDGVNANAKNMLVAQWYMLRCWKYDIQRLGYLDKWIGDILYLARCIGCEALFEEKIKELL